MSIGERIKQRRSQLELSQQDLADAIGMDQNRIWRYEKGRSIPQGDVVAHLAKVLMVSTDWLLGVSDLISPIHEDKLDDDEIELLNLYRSKSRESREKVREIVKVL